MTTLLRFFGLVPTADERELLKHLRKKESSSMRVVGRGTLTMSAKEARSTKKSKAFIAKMDELIG
ncbi:hypothetical protein [Methylomonas koyamae]|uniref:hypothetical protein n=1 Tax=Methylomonas koyamae TaxID=702114 RepID=UPI001C3260D9|nr:hypothetical protein [Methylomonas koyamae]WNB75502.1 hypothetical protein RI210_19825 [Methylomonas koyamae]BBL60288.1 hypothetical protein MKFW12EY_39010 [Methylomonas koyamae]